MNGILGHNFRLALPLLALAVAIPFGLSVAQAVWQIATLNAPAGTTAAIIGDGVDALAAVLAPVASVLTQAVQDNGGLLTTIAIVATAVSLAEAIRRLVTMLRGPGDAARFVAFGLARARRILSMQEPLHPWGTVRDVQSGYPVTFARVRLTDDAGRTVASAVSDHRGRYGFPVPFSAAHAGIGVAAAKNGYHDLPRFTPAMTAGVHSQPLDVPMDRVRASRHMHSDARWATAHVAFLAGALTVPLIALGSGGAGVALAALFGIAGAVNLLTDTG